jgi:uncharacterized membrane protein (UPF0127 family)
MFMLPKTKKTIIWSVAGLVVLAILLNFVSGEIFSLRYWNLIRRVYFKNTLVKAEVVKSQRKIEQGLAWRKKLPAERGMLFAMPSESSQRFWMKGMQFSIDIIWIKGGRVVGCEERISPDDQRIFTSPGAAGLVL